MYGLGYKKGIIKSLEAFCKAHSIDITDIQNCIKFYKSIKFVDEYPIDKSKSILVKFTIECVEEGLVLALADEFFSFGEELETSEFKVPLLYESYHETVPYKDGVYYLTYLLRFKE